MGRGNSSPKVSVIMAVYNGERFLRQALESILCQSLRDFEFIVVDDGSTDSTSVILSSYDDPRLIILRNERNLGLPKSLNKALEIAKGDYIARMDADDISTRERLELQAEFLDRNKQISAVTSWVLLIDERNRVFHRWQTTPQNDEIIHQLRKGENPLTHGAVMIRASWLRKLGGYRPEFRLSQDYDLWLRMADGGAIFGAVQEYLYKLRWSSGSQSMMNRHKQIKYRNLALKLSQERSLQGSEISDLTKETEKIERDSPSKQEIAKSLCDMAWITYKLGPRAYKYTDRLILKSLRIWPFLPNLWSLIIRRTVKAVIGAKRPTPHRDTMRILAYTKRLRPAGGGEYFFSLIAQQLCNAGHEVVIVTMISPDSDNQYVRMLYDAGADIINIQSVKNHVIWKILTQTLSSLAHTSGIFLSQLGAREISKKLINSKSIIRSLITEFVGTAVFWRLVRERNIQAMYIIGPKSANSIRWANRIRLPAIYISMEDPTKYPALSIRFRELAPKLSAATVVASCLESSFREVWGYDGPIAVLPSCVEEPCQYRINLNTKDWIEIGSLTRFSYEKNIPNLLTAISILIKRGHNVRLTLAGNGPEQEHINRVMNSLNLSDIVTLTFVQDKDALFNFMSNIDIYTLSSDTEGLPLSIIEAMSYKKPVVSTDVGGVSELVVQQETGLLVPPGDPVSLANALQFLIEHPNKRRSMGEAAYRRYLERYRPRVARNIIQSLLREVINNHQR